MGDRRRRAASACFVAAGVAACLAACAPTVDGPVEKQHARDREDAAQVTQQLAHLPGAVSASVTIRRPVSDPLAPSEAAAATTTVGAAHATAVALIVVDDRADRDAISTAATTLLRTVAPEVTAPTIVTMVGAHRPELAKVGPFTVEAGSKSTLKAALAIAFAAIAGLAAWIAVRERQRRRSV